MAATTSTEKTPTFFSCNPLNNPDERRAIRRYVFSRYDIQMMDGPPKFGNSMYFNRKLPSHGAIPSNSNSNNMMFCARYNLAVGRRHEQPRQFLLLMTRAIGCSRSGSIVLINRSVDSCIAASGLFAPTDLFDEDTLIEGEIEDRLLDGGGQQAAPHRVFCVTDILVWHGRSVGVVRQGGEPQSCMMNVTQRTELLHTWFAKLESSNNNDNLVGGDKVEIVMPVWHTSIEGLYRSLFLITPTRANSNNISSATTITHIVARHNNKCATQKDALIPLILDGDGDDRGDDRGDTGSIIQPADVTTVACGSSVVEVCPEPVRHHMLFYVRATHMPDVYEFIAERSRRACRVLLTRSLACAPCGTV
eukprot:gene17257-23577_t